MPESCRSQCGLLLITSPLAMDEWQYLQKILKCDAITAMKLENNIRTMDKGALLIINTDLGYVELPKIDDTSGSK